jgi:hypothetical protein
MRARLASGVRNTISCVASDDWEEKKKHSDLMRWVVKAAVFECPRNQVVKK